MKTSSDTERRIAAHVELALHTLAERIGMNEKTLRRLGVDEVLQLFGEAVAGHAPWDDETTEPYPEEIRKQLSKPRRRE